ncbi:hypothetical protein BOTBODRAFT_38579 [Botryobasidium botryosum FD-172 SS1]|uniref:Survival protein SurE-like phosphatase/nucleotidase domain-containing protein n=1 Tax=Botryobasidium botryosum (strain FD-172 SS1) TaxID=930990 RepID=A0A067LWD3_BOTB1|nr:hypothetical protein BOTBODRAFT_38579 [Botryobasidium botryosum FD-172 SS1]
MSPLRVLLSNDDGPPGHESPYVYGLYVKMKSLGWDVKVVIPSSQKSWIGGAHQILGAVNGKFYYPRDPAGMGETSNISRPLKEGEVGEWILLDATPATCTNIALFNIYPGEIDLVVSGPNFGRNTSTVFSLASGTIGAALSSAVAGTRSIALSYGTMVHPTPAEWCDPAHELSIKIISKLWSNWGTDELGLRNGEVDLYNVNVPMVESLLREGELEVVWTRMWRNSSNQLFKRLSTEEKVQHKVLGTTQNSGSNLHLPSPPPIDVDAKPGSLGFYFSPKLQGVLHPNMDTLPEGTDAWAIHTGRVSVTPLRAGFAEPGDESMAFGGGSAPHSQGATERLWKL